MNKSILWLISLLFVASLSIVSCSESDGTEDPYARLVEQLEKFFSQEISIKRSKNGGGRIVIDFSDDRDIDRFIEKFEKRGASAEIRNNK